MSAWTDERIELLKKLYADGLSASQIARLVGGVSRNAVIGKIHRLGILRRERASSPGAGSVLRSTKSVRAPSPPRPLAARPQNKAFGTVPAAGPPVQPIAPPPVRALDGAPGSATILTIGEHMCRWPIGDPALPDFTLCGRRTEDKASYCHEHAAVAYQPAQTKKKTSPAELARSLRRYI